MTLLSPREVLQSDVVANSTMNRGRRLTGVNSYERDLGMSPLAWLRSRSKQNGRAAWYDACCGEGIALREARVALASTPGGDCITTLGVDLIGQIAQVPNEYVVVGDVSTFNPGYAVDIITCVHGLHYVADKLAILCHFYSLLAPEGQIVANLDLMNIIVDDQPIAKWTAFTKLIAEPKPTATFKNHVLTLTKGSECSLTFGLRFVGASISTEPNYSGITVVNSCYSSTDL